MNREKKKESPQSLKEVIDVLENYLGQTGKLKNIEALQTAISHLETLQKVKEMGGVKKSQTYEHREIQIGAGVVKEVDSRYNAGWNDAIDLRNSELAKKGGIKKKALSLNFIWQIRQKLRDEGDKLWAEAILAVYGNIKLEWKNWDGNKQSCECHLETGEVFKP